MIPETENPQEAKSIYPDSPVRLIRLIQVDTLRRDRNSGFLVERLAINFYRNIFFTFNEIKPSLRKGVNNLIDNRTYPVFGNFSFQLCFKKILL